VNKQTTGTLTPEQYAARFAAAKAALQLHYCNAFKFWRLCPLKRCRRLRTCSGDAQLCLKSRENEMSRETQWQARLHVLASTPADAGPPERMAREFLPAALI
jgi:hypothetical protein